jgi:UDP-N-acetylmuramoylalanine--D-glutamate ligase
MKVAVIGLGVEGKAAVKSLIERGYQVYATDTNEKLDFDPQDGLEVELGFHDFGKIESADAVMLSPSLWGLGRFQSIKSSGKLFSDILNSHRSIPTIGVTGTNGKTTTCLMISEILQKAGNKVLVGGNAGGGFGGYAEIILAAASDDYDVQVVEVCDMTLNFCQDTFDIDLVVVTNQGRDHLEVHQSQENYLKSLENFIKEKMAVVNGDDPFLIDIAKSAGKSYFFKKSPHKLNVFGSFNQENAAAAAKACEIFGIQRKYIIEGLESFEGVKGRSTVLELSGSRLVIGKTDNADAAAAVLKEADFGLVIVGTPRRYEHWRYDILNEVIKSQPEKVGLFPGLDDTVDTARIILEEEGYKGKIVELKGIQDVIDLVKRSFSQYRNIFIGGNGQNKLIDITDRFKLLQSIENK